MELKERMYIRTKNKGIEKITYTHECTTFGGYERVVCTDKQRYETLTDFANITNASYNIIDLIEVGDLLKIEYYSLRYEERVTRLFEVTYKDERYINLSNAKCEFMLIENEFNKGDKELEPIIKSVVTKEQFEAIKYEL